MTLSEMIQENREEGWAEGREEGRTEVRLETAKNMLMNNISLEMIAKCTRLSLEQVRALKKEVCVTV